MTEWFEEWFGEEYLRLYPHRDDTEAEQAVDLILRTRALSAGVAGARRRLRGGAACAGLSKRLGPGAPGSISR